MIFLDIQENTHLSIDKCLNIQLTKIVPTAIDPLVWLMRFFIKSCRPLSFSDFPPKRSAAHLCCLNVVPISASLCCKLLTETCVPNVCADRPHSFQIKSHEHHTLILVFNHVETNSATNKISCDPQVDNSKNKDVLGFLNLRKWRKNQS